MNKSLKNAIIFLVGTFIWTWSCYITIVIFGLNPYQGTGFILLFCGGCAPTMFGIIMAMTTYNTAGKKDFIKRVFDVRRIKFFWWLICIFLFSDNCSCLYWLGCSLGWYTS